MKLLNQLRPAGIHASGLACSVLPFRGVVRPVFIIGCGRSGTTVLGTALSKHRRVTYLNEPRHLWKTAYPATDIWSSRARARNGKLVLAAADTDPRKNRIIRRLFHFQTLIHGGPVLIEKLPINTFRLDFIRRIFPDARFIHLHRNGLEVARSIGKFSERGQWFGTGSYKWEKLAEHAYRHDETQHLPRLCTNDREKGLLEWRLSMSATVGFLSGLPRNDFFELSYDRLTENPLEALADLLQFIGIEPDDAVDRFVSKNLRRRTVNLGQSAPTAKERLLGGPLLPRSLGGGNPVTGPVRMEERVQEHA